jgi:TolB-like protein/DNA-binding winged helix-turn-helix (wHTH) protein
LDLNFAEEFGAIVLPLVSGAHVQKTSVKFGDFELDQARFELRRKGRAVKLERIPLELLILLVERDGSVVTRQEIISRLWGKDVFVDTEHGINTAIRKIRAALHEDAERPRYVQTVLGKGYRFIPEANGNEKHSEPILEINSSAETKAVEFAVPAPQHRRSRSPIVAGLVALVLIAGALLLYQRSHSTAHIQTIAVLPLANLSGDKSQDYFADGMTDELITMLARNTSLRVISRTSVMQYKGIERPLRDVARELGADAILEGSISTVPTGVHLNLQLIEALSDRHIWADSYDRSVNDIYALPSELSYTIAKQVKIATSPVRPQRSINPQAHDAYLRGRYFWFADNYETSLEYFKKAVELQPDYAAGWSGIADVYTVFGVAGSAPATDLVANAESAARKAVELDDSLPEAHNALAAFEFFLQWNWKKADQESLRAIELDQNFAEAHHLRSYILFALNRPKEALQEQQRSTELDPFARPWALGRAYILSRQFDAAINELRIRKQAQPQDRFIRANLANAYRYKGMPNDYALESEEAFRLRGDQKAADEIQHAFEKRGTTGILEWRLARAYTFAQREYVPAFAFAAFYASLDRREEAFKMLEAAYRERGPDLVWIQVTPDFDSLHSDERYRTIVRNIGLPPAY